MNDLVTGLEIGLHDADQLIRKRNESLESKVKERTTELDRKNNKLRQMNDIVKHLNSELDIKPTILEMMHQMNVMEKVEKAVYLRKNSEGLFDQHIIKGVLFHSE